MCTRMHTRTCTTAERQLLPWPRSEHSPPPNTLRCFHKPRTRKHSCTCSALLAQGAVGGWALPRECDSASLVLCVPGLQALKLSHAHICWQYLASGTALLDSYTNMLTAARFKNGRCNAHSSKATDHGTLASRAGCSHTQLPPCLRRCLPLCTPCTTAAPCQ